MFYIIKINNKLIPALLKLLLIKLLIVLSYDIIESKTYFVLF